MNYDILTLSSFIYGLSSMFHCMTMCGPFVGTLNIIGESKVITNLIYNIGRFCSYSIIGLLLGFLGLGTNLSGEMASIQSLSIIISGTFIIATGLALIFKKKLIPDEGFNAIVKKVLHPILDKMRNSKHHLLFAFLFGIFTGFLPCAILYPAFAMAFASGDPILGFLSMLFFFLGTLPGLFFFGLGFQKIRSFVLTRYATITGLLIIIIGLTTIYIRMIHTHEM